MTFNPLLYPVVLPANLNYCTDEDLALVASGDFASVCPRDQAVARGTDGVLSPSNPWLLTSASTNFEAAGVVQGYVVQLTGPPNVFRPPGELFGVVSSSSSGVVLRRKGSFPGAGLAPGAVAQTGVPFAVTTFAPQIRLSSVDLDRRFGVNDLVIGRRTCDLWDPTELKDATVYSVLVGAYLDASRGSSELSAVATGRADTWSAKSGRYKVMLDDLLSRVEVHWRQNLSGLGATQAPSRLSMRVSR